MCTSGPKVTNQTTIQRPPTPPEAPPVVELGSRRRTAARAKRAGTAALRIGLNIPGGSENATGGLNLGD